MDGSRFDRMTRAMASSRSRRSVLKGLVGSVGGGLLAHLGLRAVDAQPATCRAPGKNCTQNANCCSGICDTTNPDPFKRFKCACPPGQVPVNGVCGGNGPCTGVVCTPLSQCHDAGTCNPDTGACSNPTKQNGFPCNDGNACTTTDVCTNGTCAGTPVTCNDGLACTTDSCVEGSCRFVLQPGFCLIGEVCRPAGTVNPANPCQVCTPASSTSTWSNLPNTTPCNDGNACTTNDQCTNGVCGGTPVTCNDGLACTTDSCLPNGTCSNLLQPGFCLIGGVCITAGTVNPANQCQACIPAQSTTSYTNLPNNTGCNDGNDCTTNDICTNGTCAGTPFNCNDGLVCTSDSCNPNGTCNNLLLPGFCLIAGVCIATGTVNLANPCQVCISALNTTDWSAAPNGTPCSDGSSCTNTDTCQGGTCTPGTAVVCQPLSQCHVAGICNPETGACTNPAAPLGTACENPDPCLTGGTCNGAGLCTGGTPVECDQCEHCVGGSCVADPGQNNDSCNDSNACTENDICSNGTCAGTPVTCNDGLSCTTDSCLPNGTCSNVLQPNFCLIGGVCIAAGTVNPANQCQACQPATSTTSYTNLPNTTPCNDGNACTTGETCTNGVCGGGTNTCTAPPGTCGGTCRTTGDACDSGLNCIGANPPPAGGTTLCAPSTSSQMCCVSTGFVAASIPAGGCPTNNDTCYSQPNIVGACGCFSAYVSGGLFQIDCCDGDMNNPNAGNCELCAGGICPA